MRNAIKNQVKRVGFSPGDSGVRHIAAGSSDHIELTIYNENSVENFNYTQEFSLDDLSDNKVCWINIMGLSNPQTLAQFGDLFNLHSLTLEDMEVSGQRPKLEVFDDYLFVTVYSCDYIDEELRIEQVSLLLKDNIVFSLQQFPENTLAPVLKRIQAKRGRIRKEGAAYLLYCLIDIIVDHYFVAIDKLQVQADKLEEDILSVNQTGVLGKCNALRQDLLWLRQSIKPLERILEELSSEENEVFPKSSHYIQDVSEHLHQCLDNLEVMRNLLSDLFELHSSYSNLRLSEIMKFLTMMSSILIPVSFIASFFGMNFNAMPGTQSIYVFYSVVGLMLAITFSLILYFKWKKWL